MACDGETVSALLYLMGKKKFHILECQALAKVLGTEHVHQFDLVGPKSRKLCIWADPTYGMFEMEGGNGVFSVSQFQFIDDIHIENINGRY